MRLQEKKELEKRQREDQQRLAQENKERTEAQKRREQDELQRKVMQDRVARLNPNLRKFIKDLPEEEIQNLDADTLLQQQVRSRVLDWSEERRRRALSFRSAIWSKKNESWRKR